MNTNTANSTQRRIDVLLGQYGEYHLRPVNPLLQLLSIPMISISIMGLLFGLHPYAAYAYALVSMIYYLRIRSPLHELSMAAWLLFSLIVVHAMGQHVLSWCTSLFVLSWLLSSLDRQREGQSLSFVEDLQFVLIAPLYFLTIVFQKVGIKW